MPSQRMPRFAWHTMGRLGEAAQLLSGGGPSVIDRLIGSLPVRGLAQTHQTQLSPCYLDHVRDLTTLLCCGWSRNRLTVVIWLWNRS